tara:strand:- start:1 stop:2427 length:2427 start_codon:yes stop_codon:yes gene_type:complete
MSTDSDKIVTIFKNIKETDTPFHRPVTKILERIKNGASKELIKKIRTETNKTKRNELKQSLPSICFSGKFTKRSDVSLIKYSQLICLDLDGYSKNEDLKNDKSKYSKNKYVYSVFISPSGKGLKVLIKVPDQPDNHVGYFLALEKHFKSDYFDKTSKNISRVCYESYDDKIYINPSSEVWDKVEDLKYKEISKEAGIRTIPITDENKIVSILVKWHTKKFPMVEGMRNANAFTLAMALNEYGIAQTMTRVILNQYATSDFTQREIEKIIKSAYAHKDKFNSKYYEDEEKVNDIQQRLRRGESKKVIRQQLEGSMLDTELIDSVIEKAEEDNSVKFWTKSSKGIVKALPLIFKNFLQSHGFYKYCPEDQKAYMFVRVTNNLVNYSTEKEIKDFILGYLIELDDMSVYNYFADQTRLFKEEFLTLLDTIDIFFIEDTQKECYLFYENKALKITEDELTPIDYLDLPGFVWKDHIIDRPFTECEIRKGDYKRFISNICDNQESRIKSMESTIGFMLHGYKDISFCPALILLDEQISDRAEGGTGKGIFFQAISAIKKLVTIDGKAFNFEKSFNYQTVSPDTQIIVFDDVKKDFPFERLFSVITESLTIEKKNKQAITIPFSKSPKIAITTNYVIKGRGNSFTRRKWELELSQHYNELNTPLDEFGKYLFGGWDEEEWCQFDNYMISCVQLKLKRGLIVGEQKNIKIKGFMIETDEEFAEWCGLLPGSEPNNLLPVNEKIYMNFLFAEFVQVYPDFGSTGKRKLSMTRFYKWLKAYAFYTQKVEAEVKRDNKGKWIRIRPTHEDETQHNLIF